MPSFSIEKPPTEPCRYVPFPFGLAYVAGLLEREHVPVEVFDGVALNATEETFLDRCASYRPSLILMEATTPTIEHDLALCAKLKQRTGALIALAGAHPTTFAEPLLLFLIAAFIGTIFIGMLLPVLSMSQYIK